MLPILHFLSRKATGRRRHLRIWRHNIKMIQSLLLMLLPTWFWVTMKTRSACSFYGVRLVHHYIIPTHILYRSRRCWRCRSFIVIQNRTIIGTATINPASPSGLNRIGESNEEASSRLSSSLLTDVSSEIIGWCGAGSGASSVCGIRTACFLIWVWCST